MKLSQLLKQFLTDTDTSNTLHNLFSVVKTKVFALAMVIMFIPAALPAPTGGVTHIMEVIAFVLAIQMVLLRPYPWLPSQLMHYELRWASNTKFVNGLTGFLLKIEHFLRPRFAHLLRAKAVESVSGMVFICLAVGAFFAPPFTGLDTLPALGAIIVGLALIVEDFVMWIVGMLIGILGCVLVVTSYVFGVQIFGYLWQQLVNSIHI